MPATPDPLDEAIQRLARSPTLLVATDYDGTLAPIVDNPDQATPLRKSIVALRALAAMPHTGVAVVSGRSLADLSRLSGLDGPIMLVGSHGSEFDLDFTHSLTKDELERRDRILQNARAIARRDPAFRVESKPASIAFHYRNADTSEADRAVRDLLDGPGSMDGVHVKRGKKVLELAVVRTSKGDALDTIRQRVGATATLFLGDDATDEDAFTRLSGPDAGVKVGPGGSAARFRVDDPADASRTLARLAELRQAWLTGARAVPIEQHAMLSDGRVLALVAPGARVTYMCVPRVDGPALFAELLGGEEAGHFTIEPENAGPPPRARYENSTLVLRTEWSRFSVTDFLDCSAGKPHHRAGRTDLLRLVEGRGDIRITFAPRPDFGRVAARLVVRDDGIEIADTIDPIVLRAPGVTWELQDHATHQTAIGRCTLAGEPLLVELRYGTGTLRERSSKPIGERYRLTRAYWESWAERLILPRRARDTVLRSALTIKGLCYTPTGGIAAAATTSLPEHIGGVRNWDYRFCWLRDAAMSAAALVKLGSFAEAMSFLDWMLGVVDRASAPDRLMPLYTVTGHEAGAEAEISELSGYAGSRPVRVGNAARGQVQLDVFGPIVELVWQLQLADAPVSSEHWRLVESLVAAVEARWQEPDHGIWEVRKPPQHHVHSKVMCWVTIDRAIRIASQFLDRARPEWEALRDRIAADVLEKAWQPDARSFSGVYGADHADAAVLAIGLSGILDCRDERFISTLERIERDLREGPTVYRYHGDDGLPGREGGFFICASWLVDAFHRAGRVDDAESLFNDLLELGGPHALFPEQFDPEHRRTLGNHPQAYSHIGIIENAITLS